MCGRWGADHDVGMGGDGLQFDTGVSRQVEAVYTAPGDERMICPSLNGGKNWPAGAYSPLTNTMYFPLQNTCMVSVALEDTDTSLYGINTKVHIADGTKNVGAIHAISVQTGQTVWKYEQRAGTLSVIATGGGLLFGGDANGRFRALDDRTGKVLWETNLGSPVSGYPISFSSGGKQYVAVSTGPSLVAGGVGRLTPELKAGTANQMFVFALP